MEQLWEQVRKLVYWHASRYIKRSTKETNRFDMDDLMQSGYFGVVSAVGYYDPEDGIKFSTYLNWTLRKEFDIVAGVRSRKQDPLDDGISLDAPIYSADKETSKYKLIKNHAAAKTINGVEEAIFRAQLKTALAHALLEVADRERDILISKYYAHTSFLKQAIKNGVSRQAIHQLEANALTKIRNNCVVMSTLASFMPEFGYDASNYHHENSSWAKEKIDLQEAALGESSPFLI